MGYSTKQRRELTEYLAQHADTPLSAPEIAAALGEDSVSLSAVYRNLAALEEAGLLRRCAKAGKKETYYRYVGAQACQGHLHLSCRQCGRTYHLPKEQSDALITRLEKEEAFLVDSTETVLYGVCKACQKRTEPRQLL